jgi:type III pantothenate kinase
MLLTIDAGNTNVVFAIFDGETQVGSWRCATDPRRTSDEYAVWLTHLMALRNLTPADIDAAILASVVPGATHNLKWLCRDHFTCTPMMVGDAAVDLGMMALVERPEEVGADRLVNAVAAAAAYDAPLIVIDFGTATTFDIVDSGGNYCGGVIAPGINLSLEALHMAAAKLPRVDIVQPAHVIGKGTITAMQSGIFWGYIGLIEGLVTRIKAEFTDAMAEKRPMMVIGTGGLAGLFAKATDVIDRIDDSLTIRGLYLIHQRNR